MHSSFFQPSPELTAYFEAIKTGEKPPQTNVVHVVPEFCPAPPKISQRTAKRVHTQYVKLPGPPLPPRLTVNDAWIDPMLTTVQAAVILGKSHDVVKKWRQRAGKGPLFFRYPDGSIRYRLSDLLDFINQNRVQR
jgi:hypothetical protein